MIKTKDGYAKVIGTTYQGSPNYLLLSDGGAWAVHTGRNNEANKIVRTDASGYLLVGWINTTSGDMGATAINKIYCSNDSYIRYKTPANFFSSLANSGDLISITVASQNRLLTVAYAITASLLRSKGTLSPQTGRTLSLGDVYSYHITSAVTGGPTTYAAVIGFGRGTAGTVEIAGEWTAGRGVWVRALRDTTDNWYAWDKVLTLATYTSITDGRYYTKALSDDRFVNVTGDSMTGNLRFTNTTGLIQTSNTTSNYTALLKWYTGSSASASGTNDALIGRHNTGNTTGTITILPYATTTDPWSGAVGLYIGKNLLRLDGLTVLHSGNYLSYFGYIGTTRVQGTGTALALSGISSINGRLTINAESDQTRLGFGAVHNVVFGEPGYAHRIYYFRPSYGASGTTNASIYILNASAASSPTWTNTHIFNYDGTATHTGYNIAAGFKKSGSSDSYVLLGGGGHKLLSTILSEYNGRYVNVTGDTMVGKLSISINSTSSLVLSLLNTTTGWTYMTMGNGTSGTGAVHLAWKTSADGAIPANAYHIRPGGSVSIAGFTSSAIYLAQRLVIDSAGRCYPIGTGARRAGMYGIYDSYKIGHIWSMGTGYMIPDDGANFGNLYGLAYKHTNNSTGGAMAGGHLAIWCANGTPKAALGENGVWAAGGFYKAGCTATHLLRGDGGLAAFNWSGLGGQPTWLWGGNAQHTYYVYNPSNFNVAKANKADQLEAYTASNFTGGNHYLRAIRYDSWHTRLYMGYYRDTTLQNTVHVGYSDNATTASYLTLGFSATYTNNWNCNTPDRVVYSDYGSAGRSISNAPSGWSYGTLLSLGHTNYLGLNGNLSIQLMWDIAHNTKNGGTLWFRGRDSINGWNKIWCKVVTDLNYTAYLTNYYTKSESDARFVNITGDTMTGALRFNVNNNGNANVGSGDGFKLFYNHTTGTGFPTSYSNVASFLTGYTGFQLASYGGADQTLYFRKRLDNGTWHSWYSVLHTGNYTGTLDTRYVTSLGTSGNYLTWTKNGAVNNITIPYATKANRLTLVSCYNGTTNNDLWSKIKTSDGAYIGTAIIYEVYNDGGPTTYGEVLDIVSVHSNHWQPLLWFDSGKTGSIRHRNKDYNNNSWGSWYTLLDTNNYAGTLDTRYVTSLGTSGDSLTWVKNGATNKITVPYASRSTYLYTNYIGGVQHNPLTYFSLSVGLKVAMTGNWSTWSDTLWINGYAGGDVLQCVAIHTLRNGQPRMALSVQASNATSYGTKYEIWTSYNFNPNNLYWANIKVSASASTSTLPTFDTAYASNWFRSTGQTGWYSLTYGGGWHMTDTTYIRAYNNKRVYNANTELYSFYTAGGMTAIKGFWHPSVNSNSYVLLAGGSYKLWSESSSNSTIVARNSSGYIYASYFNSAISNNDSMTISSVYCSNDNFIRKVSLSAFKKLFGVLIPGLIIHLYTSNPVSDMFTSYTSGTRGKVDAKYVVDGTTYIVDLTKFILLTFTELTAVGIQKVYGSYTSATTEGSNTHKITNSEMPAHRHFMGVRIDKWGDNANYRNHVDFQGTRVPDGDYGNDASRFFTRYAGAGIIDNVYNWNVGSLGKTAPTNLDLNLRLRTYFAVTLVYKP